MSDTLNELRLLQRSGKDYHTRRIAGQTADKIERLERELAEAREVIKLGVAAATGKDVLWVDALERMDAFLRSAADKSGEVK